jgi:sugar phosphate isomerase/epimerase
LPLGFSSVGLSDHRLTDAVRLIAEIGYDAIALRLHRRDLNARSARRLQQRLEQLFVLAPDRQWILETDGRFLLDREQADQPTIMDPDKEARQLRINVIRRALRAVSNFEGIVTVISGPCPPGMEESTALDRLAESLLELNREAQRLGVTLALRPAVGNLISRISHYERLLQWIPGETIPLAVDIASMLRGHELPVNALIARHADKVCCVFAADVAGHEEDDLPPGAGQIHWPALVAGLKACWHGPLCVRYEGNDPQQARDIFDSMHRAVRH